MVSNSPFDFNGDLLASPGLGYGFVFDLHGLNLLAKIGRPSEKVDLVTHFDRPGQVYYCHADPVIKMGYFPDQFSYNFV